MNCYLEAICYIINDIIDIKDLPYLFSWNFDLTFTNTLNTIRKRFTHSEDLFYRYCGVKIEKKAFDKKLLLNSLENKFNIIIKIDVYNCNWIKGYKSFHFPHYFVLKDYEKESNQYMIIDPFIDDVSLKLISADEVDLNCEAIITVAVEKKINVDQYMFFKILISNYRLSNNFVNFDYLCETIYKSEISDFFNNDDAGLNNIIIVFNQLAYERKKISDIIKVYFVEKTGRKIACYFDDLAKKYEKIKFIMIKLFLLNRVNEKDKEELCKLINKLKLLEIEIFNLINEYLDKEKSFEK